MQTLHQVLKRGNLVWNRQQLPESLFHERLSTVQAAISAAGHDAWLIYGDALRYGALAYITNFLPRVRNAVALVPREGVPILLVSVGPRDIPAVKTLTWVNDVRPFTQLPDAIAQLLREHGLEQGHIGLVEVERSMSIADWDELNRLVPDVCWIPVDDVLESMRVIKDAAELTVMRQAAKIVSMGLARAAEVLRPGVTEQTAVAVVDKTLRYAGIEDVRILIASGSHACLRPTNGRLLEAGDTVLLHIAVEYQRYWVEAGRTFVLGTASDTTRSCVRIAQEALETMRSAARAGALSHQVAEAALGVLRPVGLAYLATAVGLGHGIGLDLEESPFLSAEDHTMLPAGSCLAFHIIVPGQTGPGALIGQTVVVEPDGAKLLAEAEPSLVEIP